MGHQSKRRLTMKRIIQRLTAAVVSAGILCGMLGIMPAEKPLLSNGQIEAKAASTDFTADQAVQWARDRVNEQKNDDSSYLDGYPVFPWQTRLQGDVNADGSCSIADAVLLHKWLLTEITTLAKWKNGDMNGDGILNTVDLTLLKRAILSQ